MTLLTTPIFDFDWVMSDVTISTQSSTPSLVKTSLKKDITREFGFINWVDELRDSKTESTKG